MLKQKLKLVGKWLKRRENGLEELRVRGGENKEEYARPLTTKKVCDVKREWWKDVIRRKMYVNLLRRNEMS